MTCHEAALRRVKNFWHSVGGAAAVELAVVIPVLALLALGAAEYGRLQFTAITVANAARAGVQAGAQSTVTSSDTAAINQATRNEAADIGAIGTSSRRFCLCPDGSTPACTSSCPGYGVPQVFVQASATKSVAFLMAYPGLPAAITVTRSATFRVQ
jgi:Flp pilus assembly protein TadG